MTSLARRSASARTKSWLPLKPITTHFHVLRIHPFLHMPDTTLYDFLFRPTSADLDAERS